MLLSNSHHTFELTAAASYACSLSVRPACCSSFPTCVVVTFGRPPERCRLRAFFCCRRSILWASLLSAPFTRRSTLSFRILRAIRRLISRERVCWFLNKYIIQGCRERERERTSKLTRTTIPVGRCLRMTQLDVLLIFCPPFPDLTEFS